jgi:hypothetical protein
MKLFSFLLSVVLSFFNDTHGIGETIIQPIIHYVNGVKSIIGKTSDEVAESIQQYFGQFSQEQLEAWAPLLSQILFEFKVLKKNEILESKLLFLELAKFLDKKPKAIQDAILFKIASQLVRGYSAANGEELSNHAADTLTQMGFTHAKSYIPEIVAGQPATAQA